MKNLLIILLTICFISCEFEAKSFAEIGGILYTFQLPANTSQADVDKLQDIFEKRIKAYVRQKPIFKYDEEKQQLSVGVPKSLTSKNPDLCRELLTADGSVLMVRGKVSYFNMAQELENVQLSLEEKPIEIDGELSEQLLFDLLELLPSQQVMPFIGVASSIADTALIMKMIEDERFQDKFEKDIIWTWKVNKDEMKAYLHAYTLSGISINEANVEEMKIEKSMDYLPALNMILDKEGTDKFKKMTLEAAPVKGIIHIFVNQKLIMSPTVQTPITEGRVQITGDNMEEVIFMKSIIEAGRLPVAIELISEEEK